MQSSCVQYAGANRICAPMFTGVIIATSFFSSPLQLSLQGMGTHIEREACLPCLLPLPPTIPTSGRSCNLPVRTLPGGLIRHG